MLLKLLPRVKVRYFRNTEKNKTKKIPLILQIDRFATGLTDLPAIRKRAPATEGTKKTSPYPATDTMTFLLL